jgi:dethiobiotin synthetase
MKPEVSWTATERSGVQTDVTALDEAFQEMAGEYDAVVVEETGGLVAPVTRDLSWDALFVAWELDLVVVASNRPAVLSHTLLVVRAAHDAGLRVRGVVLNDDAPLGPGASAEGTRADALRTLLAPVPLLRFPHLERPDDPDALADAAERAGLAALLRERERPAS